MDAGSVPDSGMMRDAGVGADAGADASGCAGTSLLPVPSDPSVRGPWDVGVRTVTIGRLTVEVEYPAQPGGTTGVPEATYNLVSWLPQQEQSKVPPSHSPDVGPIGGHLYRDVPIDGAHGPYPVVIMIHGTASMRIASGSVQTHWASRGFVVVAADYPGLFLTDQLNAACGYPQTGAQDIPGDVTTQIQALDNPTGELAFLDGHVDMTRIGIAGHSQGGCLAATLTNDPGVRIVVPMSASTPTTASTSLQSIMRVAGIDDQVIGYDSAKIGNIVCPNFAVSDTSAYNSDPGPPQVTKRLVGITGGGHLVPTDLCQTNDQGLNAIQEAEADGVCGIDTAVFIGLPALFDCGATGFDMAAGIKAVEYATTAALEETLQCRDESRQFADMQTTIPLIGDFQHSP